MRLERLVIVMLTAALVLALGGTMHGDQKGVLAKIAEAEKAGGEAAVAALAAAKAMVEADVADAGDYAKAVGSAVASRLGALAEAWPNADESEEELPVEAVKTRVGDLYGAILPAAQGRFAEAAVYIKSAAAGAPTGAREKLEAVAAGAAGEDEDLAMKSVRAGVIMIYFSKALAAMNEGDRKSGMVLLKTGVEYFAKEADSAGDAAQGINDTAGMLRMELDTLQKGRMDPAGGTETVLEMMDSVAGELIESWTVE